MSDSFIGAVEMLIVVGAMLCGATLVALGYAAGKYAVADDCKTFGAFKSVGAAYECKEKK
jgi:hypothetical protein